MRWITTQLLALACGLSVACSSGTFGGGDISSVGKREKDKKDDDGDVTADDESQSANRPIQVSGSFLTLDCGLAKQLPNNMTADREAVGCAMIDRDKKTKFTGPVAILGVQFVFNDKTSEKPKLQLADTGSPWHVITSLPKGRINAVVAVAGSAVVAGKNVRPANSVVRSYNPDNLEQAPPPSDPTPLDLPEEPVADNATDPGATPAADTATVAAPTGTAASVVANVVIPFVDADSNHVTHEDFDTTKPIVPFSKAYDPDDASFWTSGVKAEPAHPVWIWLDLGEAKTIHRITAVIERSDDPDMQTVSEFFVGGYDPRLFNKAFPDDGATAGEASTKKFNKPDTRSGDTLEWTGTAANVRYIRILTTKSASFVAWRDIKVYE